MPVDATFTLERNEWQGVVEPRLLLRTARALRRRRRSSVLGEDGELSRARLRRARPRRSPPGLREPRRAGARVERPARARHRGADHAAAARPASRCSSLCADALARGATSAAASAASRSPPTTRSSAAPLAAMRFRTSSLLDPPDGERGAARSRAGAARRRAPYLAWGAAELRFAAHIHEREYGLRDSLAACYRALRDRGGAAGRELEAVLRGEARGTVARARGAPAARSSRRSASSSSTGSGAAVDRDRRGRRDARAVAGVPCTTTATTKDGLEYLGSTTRQAA